MLLASFLLFFILTGLESSPCALRNYGSSSFVCVCNSTYCDTLDPVEMPSANQALLFESNEAEARFSKSFVNFSTSVKSGCTIAAVNRTERFQFILGFGGAFTDSTGINIASLPAKMQIELINGYYSEKGLEYSIGRVPIASCDFSTHAYSYDNVDGDFNLEHFQLAKEDFKYKIPYIQMAKLASARELLLFGSPWSAPGWMKTNGQMNGKGTLKGSPGGKYFQTWANYFVRFLQAYEMENITFWGLTAQNEPTDGYIADFPFQAMGFTPEAQRDFIKMNLGPTLDKAGFGIENIKLMIMDDQRFMLPRWVDVVLKDPEAAQYISGVAFHWYLNGIAAPQLLDIIHKKFPGVFFLPSEACAGSFPWEIKKVDLGSWDRAERYAHDIIQDLLHWSIGWIDWNLALDTEGGPNWVKNFVDSPVIVNATAKEFYRQPMYYALAQFSKLLSPGSVRIGLNVMNPTGSSNVEELDIAAFETPQDTTVIIIVNRKATSLPIVLHDVTAGYLKATVSAHSIQSYVWSSKR